MFFVLMLMSDVLLYPDVIVLMCFCILMSVCDGILFYYYVSV